jgi:hypothetical protein
MATYFYSFRLLNKNGVEFGNGSGITDKSMNLIIKEINDRYELTRDQSVHLCAYNLI